MREIETLLRELKRYGNAGRDCALAAEDALTIATALEATREDGARLEWLADQIRIVDLHFILDSLPLKPCELRVAIDRARGKTGGEVKS